MSKKNEKLEQMDEYRDEIGICEKVIREKWMKKKKDAMWNWNRSVTCRKK